VVNGVPLVNHRKRMFMQEQNIKLIKSKGNVVVNEGVVEGRESK
jgi:hypothetical protein